MSGADGSGAPPASAFDPAGARGAAVLDALACPVCRGALLPDSLPHPSSLRCPLGHTADIARQGYVSLLRGRHATSGDTAAMVAARAGFLATGHYGPLADAIARLVPPTAGLVLDLGCGTGYYLARVLDEHPHAVGLGLDLSGHAARRAARAHPRAAAATADTWQELPLRDGAADALLSVFAPRNAPEMRRVLAGDGVAVVATPTGRHLHEVRERFGMLGIDDGKAERVAESLAGFTADERVDVEYRVAMRPEELRDDVLMGPSAHHVDEAVLDARLAGVGAPIEVTVAVTVVRYRAG